MGYTTEFTGELKFTNELTAKQLAKVKSFLGEDCREHPEWGNTNLTYIDLELLDDFSGLKWDCSEKTYDLPEKINLLIDNVKKEYPDFGLSGRLFAQGEEIYDRWTLTIENGVAVERKTVIKGKKVSCPHCKEEFIVENEDEDSEEGVGLMFVFTGFRNEILKEKLEARGHKVSDSVTNKTTHLIVKDPTKESSKYVKARDFGCEIWTIGQLEEFIMTQTEDCLPN
jgi:NAD-dependent DNA ligase